MNIKSLLNNRANIASHSDLVSIAGDVVGIAGAVSSLKSRTLLQGVALIGTVYTALIVHGKSSRKTKELQERVDSLTEQLDAINKKIAESPTLAREQEERFERDRYLAARDRVSAYAWDKRIVEEYEKKHQANKA